MIVFTKSFEFDIHVLIITGGGGGGGGTRNIYRWRCALSHKKGGGVLHVCAGTSQKRWVLGCGHNPKKWGGGGGGGLRCENNPKRGQLVTGLVKERVSGAEVAQKGVLWSLFINYLYFYLST